MELAEVKTFLETNKDDAAVKTLLSEFTPITTDAALKFLASDPEGKRRYHEQIDKDIGAAVIASTKKYEAETLPGKIDAAVKERHPDETPQDKRIAELEKIAAASEKDAARAKLLNTATNLATEKTLPTELLPIIIGNDEVTTTENMTIYEKVFTEMVTEAVEAKFKGNGRTIADGGNLKASAADLSKMTPEQRLEYVNTNPQEPAS